MKSVLATICGICVFLAYIAGLLLHLLTCYIAYQVGFLQTVLTFAFPVLSELYWFGVLWSTDGFLNIYTVAFLFTVLLWVIGFGGLTLLEDKNPPEA